MEEPHRTQPPITYCVCRLVAGVGYDVCGRITSGPDQPFCDACERNGHHESELQRPLLRETRKR